MTCKERVQNVLPSAMLDYSEYMRNKGAPCYFIRAGLQGPLLHEGLYRSAKAAWKACDEAFRAAYLAHRTAELQQGKVAA